ncbi:hypothetical protein [Streptomyces alkaliphilus]|nr:hypothetical protein [Streptomyces alkaliphilus]MQS06943.1 hypothetical protein [Streptomyces alkaliphilus]
MNQSSKGPGGAAGLPIPEYDQLTPGELEHRIRSLEPEGVDRLLAHEREHADRPQVVNLLTERLAQMEEGSPPTPGGDPRPGHADGGRGGSPVHPQTSPQPFHSPPHGTPQQPARPKADERRP